MVFLRSIYGTIRSQSLLTTDAPLLRRTQASSLLCHGLLHRGAPQLFGPGRRSSSSQFLPTILQPSFWRSLMPKALRSGHSVDHDKVRPKVKDWNPATFFIWIFLFIGSQAIQMIAMQRDFVQFTNHTEARLALLREVVKKVQSGEDVDVEAVLGTGNAAKEKEWEEVMRELEAEDALIQSRRQKRKAKEAAKTQDPTQDTTAT